MAVMSEDERWMQAALEMGARARRISPPNPSVGAVIVRDGRLIGAGHTQAVGGPHAEVMALRDAASHGESVAGATIYVTLEPCSHYGHTPPCAKALIEHGLARVVVAVLDPNPLVSGRGIRMLEAAGIVVTTGVCSEEASWLNRGFLKRMSTGLPWVRLKVAATLDGRTALSDGRSMWITGEQARADNQIWRAEAGAVLTGIGTIKSDNPQLNVRLADQHRQPLRVLVDKRCETPLTARVLEGGGVLIFAAADPEGRAEALRARGAEVVMLPDATGEHVDLMGLLHALAAREVNEVHLEAGSTLNGAFLLAGLVDEILLYTAPCFFGAGKSIAALPEPATPAEAERWKIWQTKLIGNDMRTILLRRK